MQAYVGAWRVTDVVPEPERRLVTDTLHDVVSEMVEPWPQDEVEPVPMHEVGRFVKAFPHHPEMSV